MHENNEGIEEMKKSTMRDKIYCLNLSYVDWLKMKVNAGELMIEAKQVYDKTMALRNLILGINNPNEVYNNVYINFVENNSSNAEIMLINATGLYNGAKQFDFDVNSLDDIKIDETYEGARSYEEWIVECKMDVLTLKYHIGINESKFLELIGKNKISFVKFRIYNEDYKKLLN